MQPTSPVWERRGEQSWAGAGKDLRPFQNQRVMTPILGAHQSCRHCLQPVIPEVRGQSQGRNQPGPRSPAQPPNILWPPGLAEVSRRIPGRLRKRKESLNWVLSHPGASLLLPSPCSELWSGRGGPSGVGAAQVTCSPGLQVSQTTAHIPALPRGKTTPALCSLALSPPPAAPTAPQGCFLPVTSLISKGSGSRGGCRRGR